MWKKLTFLIKKIRFNIQYNTIIVILKKSKESALVTYPLLIKISFNKEEMFKKYINTGKSAKFQVLKFIKIMEKHNERDLNLIGKPESESMKRLQNIRKIRESKYFLKYELADLEQEFGKSVDDLVNEAMNNNN